MANLKEIKGQIRSVKNTEKTTKAMKLVSNVKLKRAKQAAVDSKAYAQKLYDVLSEISKRMQENPADEKTSKFFDLDREVKVVDLIFITADKGLCGGFNIYTIKAVRDLIKNYQKQKIKVRLRAIGKKGIEYFNFQGVELYEKYLGVSSSPNYDKAKEIITSVVDDFYNGETDRVILVYNGYKNMISQEIHTTQLVPIQEPNVEAKNDDESLIEFEPADNAAQILEELLKKYFEYGMYFALIDSLAAEHSARMNAMENATNNAKERVRELNLTYNKARQSSITNELIEIISGVEAMK